jgi:hypothetical protein
MEIFNTILIDIIKHEMETENKHSGQRIKTRDTHSLRDTFAECDTLAAIQSLKC